MLDEISKRLKKIEGQVTGISRMYINDRSCLEITQQITAIRSALIKVNLKLLEKESQRCIMENDKEELRKIVKEILRRN